MLRPALLRSDGAVDRGRTAANDSHAPIKFILRWLREQLRHFDGKVFVFYSEFDWFPQPDRNADCLVSLFEQGFRVVNFCPRFCIDVPE